MSIDQVYQMGEDALQNLWEISFGTLPVPGIGAIEGAWILRAQNFNIPASGSGTYEVHYKTHVIDRINGKPELAREFSFDMRIDRYYTIYKALTIWKNSIMDTSTNAMGPDYLNAANKTNYRIPITVKPTGADGKVLSVQQLGGITTAWTFEGCYPKTIGELAFDYTGGEPLIVNVTFGFLKMKDFLA